MIPSTSPEPDQQQLRDYLLGKMPEDAAAGFDARLFESKVLVEELNDEQQALIEDYLNDRLTAEELTLFRLQLSKSRELQREVTDLSHLLSALQKEVDASASREKPALFRLLFVLSPALAILLCAVTLLYLREHHKSAELESELQTSRHTTAPVMPALAGGQPIVTAFLSANVVRGSSRPQEITLPRDASILELQVELHSPLTDAKDWNVALLAAQEILVQSNHTHLHQAGKEMFLTLLTNTRDLTPGTYTIRYAPASDRGAVQTRLFVVRLSR